MAENKNMSKIPPEISPLKASESCFNNPAEIVECNCDGTCKISADCTIISDGDEEVEIVDVVVDDIGCEESFLNQSRRCSNSSENLTNTTSVEEIQIIDESVKSTPKKFLENDFSEAPAIVNESDVQGNGTQLILPSCSMTDAATDNEAEKESHLHINVTEKCTSQDDVETIEIDCSQVQLSSDSAISNDTIDIPDETNEFCSYSFEYDLDRTPTQIIGCWKEFSTGKKNNFTRGCKWAPDGSCILTCSDDNKLRIFNLPPQLWDSSQWFDYISEPEAALRISEGDLIYDYCWYPLMNSNDASTCCLASTSRKNTVHLWDAYTGELRCSYRSFNHLDELATPHSLGFDSDGAKLFCGFQNIIRVFDVNRPGRLFEERQIYAYKTGQSGIISCFAFTSADKNVSAAGSYSKTIGLYAEPYGELSCLLEGQGNGITQLQFSPDGKYLYSGGRKDPDILCWDLRNLGHVLFTLRRSCETNQRIYFDISSCGKYVVSGNQNGVITFWDVTKEPEIVKEDDFPVLLPKQFFMAHHDCVNGVSLHPQYPFLCSSSGQRKFPVLLDDDNEEIFSRHIEKQDNSLRLWWIGKLNK